MLVLNHGEGLEIRSCPEDVRSCRRVADRIEPAVRHVGKSRNHAEGGAGRKGEQVEVDTAANRNHAHQLGEADGRADRSAGCRLQFVNLSLSYKNHFIFSRKHHRPLVISIH